MKIWKKLPYGWKVVSAFVFFFSTTLCFAYFKGRDTSPNVPIEVLATTPTEANSWKGHPKVVYFWATWCTVCKAYAPILEANLKLLPKSTVFLSVLEAEDSEETKEIISQLSPEAKRPIYAADYRILKEWRISAYPTTVFLNEKGKVVFSDTGILSPVGFWLRSFLLRFF
ncbi:thioredoxin domain-containing protein [Leptospira sp. 85282-16]|uniref:TlpA family protein disulfide reductase n=1 Tax=Leptospira montravelensis TaxID=2484961 RepID=A0ABY2LYN9_9LEPT|nr:MULTISPECIES: thioredoxin-like domain-containing protein [Leptospira]MCT8333062.1 thioredoxin domain-containing protein [Leptospira sp. 85282-16]TGK84235.1 TlpA family protein disulfide reductase [Leptospira montravelensis]TGL06245.1 TlpA family protein disulfide reductase [Leptospira montravelensis]